MTIAGWRSVCRTERRAISQICCEQRHHAGDRLGLAGASLAASSLRPVLARKTSSSDGWCSWRSAIAQVGGVERAHDRDELLARARAARRPRRAARATTRAEAREHARRPRRGRRGRPAIDLDRRAPDLGLQRLRRALGDDLAVVDDPDAVGEHVGLLEVLRGEEDGHAVLAREPRDLVPQVGAALRIEARWSARRGTGRAGGARARARGRAGASCRPSSRRPCGRPRRSSPTRSSSSSPRARRSAFGTPCSVVCRRMCSRPGQQRVERRLLQRGADRRAHRGALADDVVARHARRARGRRQQRGEHQHRRRLARAVGPEEAVDLAGRDRAGRSRRPRAGRS